MRSEFITWLRIGLLSFGGPAAHIALIQSEICDRLKWASGRDFVQGLSFATLLPGPEAMQLGVYLGWRYGGVRSGLIAGLGFVLPGAALMIALTLLLSVWRGHALVDAVFGGVQPVIVAFVLLALWRIWGQTINSVFAALIAIASFVALYVFELPFPWIAAAAAFYGLILMPRGADAAATDDDTSAAEPVHRRSVTILAAGIAAGLVILGAAFAAVEPVFAEIAVHISTAVLVVFGGAYAVIGYIADLGVGSLGWMTAPQVVDGLALSETAPGPLILFTAYAGTLAAAPGGIAQGIIGGALATAVTFLPSFVLVLAGAPYVSRLHGNPWLRRALSGIIAAVIGLIGSLAALLVTAVLWTERGMNYETVIVAALSLIILATKRVPAPFLIGLGAAVGMLRWALIGS